MPLPALVWTDVTGSWTNPNPGILLAWRTVVRDRRTEWEGWVIQAWAGGAPAEQARVFVHQSWVAAAHIRLAEAAKPQPDLTRYRPVNR